MLGFCDWINRQRHNRGYGVQSPSAFFFVTQVLKERLPYYAYDALDTIAGHCRELGRKRCRMLFRIANELAPASAIAISSATAACAISSARQAAPVQFITGRKAIIQPEASRHLAERGCNHVCGDTLHLLKEHLERGSMPGLLYIGACENQQELLETAMEHASNESIIIVEGIHRSRQHSKWWQRVIGDPRTIVTYDMYCMGILFFNSERQKQNYTLKK